MLLRRIAAALLVTMACATGAAAQPAQPSQPAPSSQPAAPEQPAQRVSRLKTFPSPDAAATAFIDALRNNDEAALAEILGRSWGVFVPPLSEDVDNQREHFLTAWNDRHNVAPEGDDKARLEIGSTGFVFPLPLIRRDNAWRFDVATGLKEVMARKIGRNELTIIQTLLAIVDAQREYAILDPMKAGSPGYARRFLSRTGQKDGLYWETQPGQPPSPLGALVADASPEDAKRRDFYGYHFRMLRGQGPSAPGGTFSYLVGQRMLGGFAVIAWPVHYGESGVMTFMVNYAGEVFERDLGPNTAKLAVAITLFDPDKSWTKADATPP
jgi:hypothetical protein